MELVLRSRHQERRKAALQIMIFLFILFTSVTPMRWKFAGVRGSIKRHSRRSGLPVDEYLNSNGTVMHYVAFAPI